MTDSLPTTAAHPPYSVDWPNEPHIGEDGDCWCLAPCCSRDEKVCICPDCCGSCGDDHGN